MRLYRLGRPTTPAFGPAITAIVLGAVAAGPSLAWAVQDPDLLSDDYGHLLTFRERGPAGALWSWATENPARPVTAVYHLLTYGLIGDRPVLQALVLAVLSGACAACIWWWGRRWVGPPVAFAAALLFAIAPNRTASRYWFATGNYVLAPLLALVGYHLLRDKERPVVASVVFAAAILTLEAVIGLVLAMLLAWVVADHGRRWTPAVLVCLPGVVAALLVTAMSPKVGVHDFDLLLSLSTVPYGLLGNGLWGDLAPLGLVLVGTAFVIGLAGSLPSFAAFRDRTRNLRISLGIVILTMAPFVATARFFSGRGFFDRSNTIPLIVIGSLLGGLADVLSERARRLLLLPAGVITVLVYALNVGGLANYTAAASEGRAIAQAVVEDHPAGRGTVLVVPPASYHSGVAAFVYPGELDTALHLRGRVPMRVLMPASEADCLSAVRGQDGPEVYDWRRRSMLPAPTGCAFVR